MRVAVERVEAVEEEAWKAEVSALGPEMVRTFVDPLKKKTKGI